MGKKDKKTTTALTDSVTTDLVSAFSDSANQGSKLRRPTQGMSVDIGKVIKKFEEIKKVTPKEVAKGAKIPYSTLMEYRVGGKKTVNPQHLISLATYFGISVDELLGLNQSKTPDLSNFKTKKIFSRWLKVTLEDLADDEEDK